jgi:putative oxidoreductase
MKKNLQENIKNICIALLILMWTYASLSKLLNYPESQTAMRNQIFPIWIADLLSFSIPILELTVAALLVFPHLHKMGKWISLTLLSAFTLYIIGIELLLFGRIPCSCGGIISGFSWIQHLLFNLTFIMINLYVISYHPRAVKIPVQRKEHA